MRIQNQVQWMNVQTACTAVTTGNCYCVWTASLKSCFCNITLLCVRLFSHLLPVSVLYEFPRARARACVCVCVCVCVKAHISLSCTELIPWDTGLRENVQDSDSPRQNEIVHCSVHKTCHLILFWAKWTHCVSSTPIYSLPVIILSFQLRLGLPGGPPHGLRVHNFSDELIREVRFFIGISSNCVHNVADICHGGAECFLEGKNQFLEVLIGWVPSYKV
jgi:hypothetical protein